MPLCSSPVEGLVCIVLEELMWVDGSHSLGIHSVSCIFICTHQSICIPGHCLAGVYLLRNGLKYVEMVISGVTISFLAFINFVEMMVYSDVSLNIASVEM